MANSVVRPRPSFIKRTPLGLPAGFCETWRAVVRMTPPTEVMAYSLAVVVDDERPNKPATPGRSYMTVSTPLPPRPCSGYSSIAVRFRVAAGRGDQQVGCPR